MSKLLPPIGISHTAQTIEDLYAHKLDGKKKVIFHPAAQPNSFPHLGTVTSLISTFALARKLEDTLGISAEVLFWELENAPGEHHPIKGEAYYRTLANTLSAEGVSASEKHLLEFRYLLKTFSEFSGVPSKTWSYGEFQSTPEIRRIILDLIAMEDELAPLLCPSERKFKVRFACPVCHLSNKKGGVFAGATGNGGRDYECFCPAHGTYGGTLSEHNKDLFDINTPVRALAREIYYIRKMDSENGQNMMSDGADWVQYATINMEALLRFGIPLDKHPARFFSPVILDESGAKLAKSAQIGSGRYNHLPRHTVDSTWLRRTFGEAVHRNLWDEVSSWQHDSRSLFRNYTVGYFAALLGEGV
ncbi:hypothetical protein [Pseudomonas syringae]|uniref:hypothetical protein n=1 Tax=Pseudomonas syringae TaxID=317 RepID=UPI0004242773|nr:hypothetical protein [Pseudomonas syringae]